MRTSFCFCFYMSSEPQNKQSVSRTPSDRSLANGDLEENQVKAFAPVKSHTESRKSASDLSSRGRSQNEYSGSQQRSRSYGDGHGFACISHEDVGNDVQDTKSEDQPDFEVAWDGEDDLMNPRSMKKARRWLIVVIVPMGSFCV